MHLLSVTPFCSLLYFFFFFNDTATTEIYTLSLHDALSIWPRWPAFFFSLFATSFEPPTDAIRSEEHTSELQSHSDLVCRLLLEKKKTNTKQDCSSQHRRPVILNTVRRLTCQPRRHNRLPFD